MSDEPSQSDHRHITFTLNATTVRTERGPIRNPRETEWSSYVEALHGRMSQFPSRYGSNDEIAIAIEILRNSIIKSNEDNCALRSAHMDNPPWWSRRLDKLRKNARKSWNIAKATGSLWDWENHKKDQRQKKALISGPDREIMDQLLEMRRGGHRAYSGTADRALQAYEASTHTGQSRDWYVQEVRRGRGDAHSRNLRLPSLGWRRLKYLGTLHLEPRNVTTFPLTDCKV